LLLLSYQSPHSEGRNTHTKEEKMTRLLGFTVLLVSVASYAFAGIPVVTGPEIDGSTAIAAVGLLGGGLLVLRARRKK
jgi:LPXTG-motif cell wall-anchored protein